MKGPFRILLLALSSWAFGWAGRTVVELPTASGKPRRLEMAFDSGARVVHFPQIHWREGTKDPGKGQILLSQFALAAFLQHHPEFEIFDEGSPDLDPSNLKDYKIPELAKDFPENFIPGKLEEMTEDQQERLARTGAPILLLALGKVPRIHASIPYETNVKITSEIQDHMNGKEPKTYRDDTFRSKVYDQQEGEVAAQITKFLERHKDRRVLLVFGAAHDFRKRFGKFSFSRVEGLDEIETFAPALSRMPHGPPRLDVPKPGYPTPLMNAAAAGDLPLVRHLLAAGADPRAQDPSGRTALILASLTGREALLEVLLEHLGKDALRESFSLRKEGASGGGAAYYENLGALLEETQEEDGKQEGKDERKEGMSRDLFPVLQFVKTRLTSRDVPSSSSSSGGSSAWRSATFAPLAEALDAGPGLSMGFTNPVVVDLPPSEGKAQRVEMAFDTGAQVVHFPQVHGVMGMDEATRGQVLLSQFALARFLQQNPDFVVFDEGCMDPEVPSPERAGGLGLSRFFPRGSLPGSLGEMTRAQQTWLAWGAPSLLLGLGDLHRILPAIPPEVDRHLQSRLHLHGEAPSKGADPAEKSRISEEREKAVAAQVKEFLKLHPDRQVLIVFGAAHDFSKHFEGMRFSRVGGLGRINDGTFRYRGPSLREGERDPGAPEAPAPRLDHRTELMNAAAAGDLPRVRDLLARHVDPREEDRDGCTALILACQFNRGDVLRELGRVLEAKDFKRAFALRGPDGTWRSYQDTLHYLELEQASTGRDLSQAMAQVQNLLSPLGSSSPAPPTTRTKD
jgi:ankyrin repeat protein